MNKNDDARIKTYGIRRPVESDNYLPVVANNSSTLNLVSWDP